MLRSLVAAGFVLGMVASTGQAKADRVEVGYSLSGSIGIPALSLPAIGPPLTGSAIISYTNAPVGPAGNSAFGGFGAFTPLHDRAQLSGMTLLVPVNFMLFGDHLTAPTPIAGTAVGAFSPKASNTLLSSGLLRVKAIGGVSGSIHCTGASCGGLIPIQSSVLTPFGLTFSGVLSGVAATPGPLPTVPDRMVLLQAFTLAGTFGTFLGTPVTATLIFTEAPLFGGGFSRHRVPEPGTAVLLGLGLVGIAAAGRRLRR